MLNIALFGPPGAGKGTQSSLLVEKYNLTYISTGDILREEIREGSKLGNMAKDIIEKGGLASDEIIVQIIENKIQNNPNANGFLFDGFPRTIVQCYILEGLLMKMNTSLTCMLSLEVPEEELLRRLHERSKTSGRQDDNNDVIHARLKEYYEKTVPVAKFYEEKNVYFPVDGIGTLEDIHKHLVEAIEKSLKNRWISLLLFGYPGSGKGSQAKLMAGKYNLVYISTGKMLREEIRKNSEIGKMAQPYMDKGAIVPDEYAIRLIREKMQENPNANGFIFKGFPRTIVQAYIVDGMLRGMNSATTAAIEIEVSPLEAIKRLAQRSKTDKSRAYDMDTDVIVSRIEEYDEKTKLARDFYNKKGLLHIVDGHGTEQEIFIRICGELDKIMRQAL